MQEKLKKIFFLNFWPYGGMRHYSDASVRVLAKYKDVVYCTNYSNQILSTHKTIPLTLNPFKLRNYFSLVKIVVLLIRNQPDVIHLNSGFPILIFVYPIFYFFNSVVTVHDAVPHEGESILKRIFHQIQILLFAIFFRRIIVHSEKIKMQMPWFVKRRKIFVIPHVNLGFLSEGIKIDKNNDGKLRVLFFGRILKYKGLEYLIEAFKGLNDKYELTIAGSGNLPIVTDLHNIRVLNRFIEDDEMKLLFSECDVVVLPYLTASQSGVVYLSYAFGKPVIATNVGSLGEIVISRVNGLLINSNSVPEIVEALKQMSNKEFRDKLSENILGQNLSNDNEIAERLLSIYKRTF